MLSEEHGTGEDHTDALVVVVSVVIVLVFETVDACQVVCVPCGYDYFVGFFSQYFLILARFFTEQKKT